MTEMFDIVDEDDKIIGRASRKECHSNPKLIHRSVGVFVFNSKGELFLQKRSLKKDTNPGLWSLSVSGHIEVGEPYDKAARREMKEELGVDAEVKYLFKFKYRVERESENSKLFAAVHNGPFKLDPEEISEGRFFSIKEIKEKVKSKFFTDWCLLALGEYFKMKGVSL